MRREDQVHIGLRPLVIVAVALAAARSARATPEPELRVLDPATLTALERDGFGLGSLLGAPGENGAALARSSRYRAIVSVLRQDLAELNRRPHLGGTSLNRSFDPRWLTSLRTRFELIGAIERLDRLGIDGGCGQARL
ncbi:MAG TPA: hypothetical protein VE964_18520, partial [Myxococcales bacterium]|nr:hypothetical protein [Myxococcales bacterium]